MRRIHYLANLHKVNDFGYIVNYVGITHALHCNYMNLFYLTLILPGHLTENTFSFTATTWGIVTGGSRVVVNEPIGSWQ